MRTAPCHGLGTDPGLQPLRLAAGSLKSHSPLRVVSQCSHNISQILLYIFSNEYQLQQFWVFVRGNVSTSWIFQVAKFCICCKTWCKFLLASFEGSPYFYYKCEKRWHAIHTFSFILKFSDICWLWTSSRCDINKNFCCFLNEFCFNIESFPSTC